MRETMNELYKMTKRIKGGEMLSEEESERFLLLSENAKRFIEGVESDYACACLTKRYIDAKPWHQIADELGQLTDDSVRKCCVRTIQRYS